MRWKEASIVHDRISKKKKKEQRRDANNFGAGAIHAGGGRESRLHTREICPKIVNIESTTTTTARTRCIEPLKKFDYRHLLCCWKRETEEFGCPPSWQNVPMKRE